MMYVDGVLDVLVILLFNVKFVAVVGEEASASANEKCGFEWFVVFVDVLVDG